MADTIAATRIHPLHERQASAQGVTITPLPPASKLSLRLKSKSVTAAAKALGVSLPVTPCRSATADTRAALWLGPDEWLIFDDGKPIDIGSLDGIKAPLSAVDISHRNTSIEVTGPFAASTLAAGCPLDLDLSAFPVGKCTRTVLGKAEIILWRTGEETFRIDCWRSFSDYVFSYLAESARDAAL